MQDERFDRNDSVRTGDAQVQPEEAGQELTVEEAFAELERLISTMETEGITLEESFACYERGIRLVRYCNERIDRVEKKVRILRGEGRPETEFPGEDLS